MEKTGHLVMGLIFGIALILLTHYFLSWFIFDLFNIGVMIFLIYVYSLLCDIDTKSGTIVWTFLGIGVIALVSGYLLPNNAFLVFGIVLVALTFIAVQFFKHRGFTHSIVFGLMVSLPLIYISLEFSVLAFVCFYSHLIADKLSFKIV